VKTEKSSLHAVEWGLYVTKSVKC